MYSRVLPLTSMLARPLVSPAALPQPALGAIGIAPPPVPVGDVLPPPHDRQSANVDRATTARPAERRRNMGPPSVRENPRMSRVDMNVAVAGLHRARRAVKLQFHAGTGLAVEHRR